MRTLVSQGTPRYTVVCSQGATLFARDEIRKLTAAIKEKTGAALPMATYDQNGRLREVVDADGKSVVAFDGAGNLTKLYGAENKRIAAYDADGALCELYYDQDRRGKALVALRPDGTVAALFDEKGKPLADCDESGALAAVRHSAGDVLTEADVEYAERLALAEARLALCAKVKQQVLARRAEADELCGLVNACYLTGREIVVGRMADRPETLASHAELPYTGVDLRFVGETLYVTSLSEYLTQKAFGDLIDTVSEGENWELEQTFAISFVDARVSTVLPRYKTENGTLLGTYYCGDENFEIAVGGTNLAEYEAYLAELKAMGFATYTENTIADCRFGTYLAPDEKAGEIVVFTMHFPGRARTQIVYGPRGYLPATEPAEMPANRIPTTFTQPRRLCVYYGNVGNAINGAPGMSYIVQLADGSYIVIDGGPGDGKVIPKVKRKGVWIDLPETETHDEEELYAFLCEHAPNGEKPRIAAWFISHPHGDHMGLANRFLEDYQGKVDIALAAFNFPDFDSVYCRNERPVWHKGCAAPFRAKMTEFYGAQTCVLHAGQRIFFPGCEVEVLYTQEDYYPTSFHWGNHLSCAFRMKFADKTVMILGDCEKTNCQEISDSYGKELKSDILQLTHHGFNGACFDINQLVDPDVCLWACDGFRFECDARNIGSADGYLFNRLLRDNSIKKREHYHCDETVTLEV